MTSALAGLPWFLHGSILEVHEKYIALATREGRIALFRRTRELLHSFPAPVTHQISMSDLTNEENQYHASMLVTDLCFVGGQTCTSTSLYARRFSHGTAG